MKLIDAINKIQKEQDWDDETIKNIALEYINDIDCPFDFLSYVNQLIQEKQSSIRYMEQKNDR